jgi:hypothetical protein
VRPERSDIAAPDLPAAIEWVGEPPDPMPRLTASGPVLVHFLDFAQLNSVRALPYPLEWHRRYSEAGLTMIGVQAPRFPFGSEPATVAAGLARLGVSHPVAIDSEREMWFDYGCEGWPSLFLWGRGGARSWFHFWEGEYAATEEAIQEEMREIDALRELPALMSPVRTTDAPDVAVMPPTPELFPGGEDRPLAGESDGLEVQYEAGGVYATIEGKGEIAATIDGEPAHPVRIEGAGLYELALHRRHESHRLKIDWVSGELRIWTVSFAAGVP